jgi:hypothetical protein
VTHGGKLAAKALKAAGVDCVFTLSGGHVMAIYDERLESELADPCDRWARPIPTHAQGVLTRNGSCFIYEADLEMG